MHTYDTVSEALADLKNRGYKHDFNLKRTQLECIALNSRWAADELTIKEIHRFEGDSDPADEAVVYAIEAGKGIRGTFVDAFGIYYNEEGAEFLQKLSLHGNSGRLSG